MAAHARSRLARTRASAAGRGEGLMTYEEISHELTILSMNAGEHVRLVRGDMEATAVHLLPVRWFVAEKMLGRLFVGTYSGPNHRLVGTKDFPFAEVTKDFLTEEFNNALVGQVEHFLDSDSVKQ